MSRPTCKVVTRTPVAGRSGGARIHPKGCKVRNRVQASGVIRKEPKAAPGTLKPEKHRITRRSGRHFQVILNGPGGVRKRFMWDTGATVTTASPRVLRELGVLTASGQPRGGLQWGPTATVDLADGSQHQMRTIRDVPLTIAGTNEVVRGEVTVGSGNGASLFGLGHIGQVKTLKVKFK